MNNEKRKFQNISLCIYAPSNLTSTDDYKLFSILIDGST